MASETQWFYASGSERIGPVDESAIRDLLQSGKVDASTLVWTGGMADWTALAQSQLARYLDGPALAVPPIQSGRAWAHDGGGPGRPMGFGEAIASVFGKYATFSGRASRSEYWYFLLFYLLVNIGANFVASGPVWYGPGAGGPLLALIPLAFFLPSIAVAVRRLHDIDRTGWWLLIAFIPVIGAIVLLVFACTAPSPGQNRYG